MKSAIGYLILKPNISNQYFRTGYPVSLMEFQCHLQTGPFLTRSKRSIDAKEKYKIYLLDCSNSLPNFDNKIETINRCEKRNMI